MRKYADSISPTSPSLRRSVAPSLLPAFTLIELIISIGLVLVIMLGVNFVFKMTSDTINAGQSLNENMRNSRASQAVMFEDFSKYAADGASLVIRSRAFPAFRNQADKDADRDGNELTVDNDGNGVETDAGDLISPATYGTRNHRADTISFFARGKFARQTGGGTLQSSGMDVQPLVADQSSNEAWIWYGHLLKPNNDFTFANVNPFSNNPASQSANPNNFFASQWTLGRNATLLIEPDENGEILSGPSTAKVANDYFQTGTASFNNKVELTPLHQHSLATRPANTTLNESRYDLAGTSIKGYRNILSSAITTGSSANDWWYYMMPGTPASPADTNRSGTRFQTTPFVRPISAASYARQMPVFMDSCSQFIVEYAGDFLRQNPNTGVVEDTFVRQNGAVYEEGTTDNEVDFVYVWDDLNNNNVIDTNERLSARKTIRWYGLPRDTVQRPRDTVTRIRAIDGDVVPLRDLWQTSTYPILSQAAALPPFEKFSSVGSSTFAKTTDTVRGYLSPTNGLTQFAAYTCAWGPSDTVRPRMIRITMVVDDPTGRTVEPQTHEYVFNLPAGE